MLYRVAVEFPPACKYRKRHDTLMGTYVSVNMDGTPLAPPLRRPRGRSTGWVRTDRAILITGEARTVPQFEWLDRFRQPLAQHRIGRLDQDRADVNAAICDDAAVFADQL